MTGNTKSALGYSDADWAGCQKTRRSTSGGVVLLGDHCLKAWSRTQATMALSSAESELYAMIKTSSEVLGILSIMKDLGMKLQGEILGDASACLGVIQRQGLGKLRHIDTNYLWIQEKSASKELNFGKVWGKVNPSDLMTKYLSGPEIDSHMSRISQEFRAGRAETAPMVVNSVGKCVSRESECIDFMKNKFVERNFAKTKFARSVSVVCRACAVCPRLYRSSSSKQRDSVSTVVGTVDRTTAVGYHPRGSNGISPIIRCQGASPEQGYPPEE